ncbi:MAG TPA: hypothetical protein VJ124_03955 [Pyrinomonadaceae bacterium]|nr:hypothetical protein [Pyrinomonadaceae bacterium]
MVLLFIHGAPAVGKLTVARKIADLSGFRLFHNHLTVDLLLSVFDFGSEPFVALREQIWLSVFREAAKQNVSLIFTFNPERTVRQSFISDTIEAIESGGGVVHFVQMVCSEHELERRLVSPSRSEYGKLTSLEHYKELKDSGAFDFGDTDPAELIVDTTDSPPDNTAQLIVKHFSLI